MDHNQCFECGGTLRNDNGRLVCENCNTYRSPYISNEEAMLLTSAYQKLRLADFSDAEAEFDDIIRRHPKCADAYWGHLLAIYGIKYEKDYNGAKIPTCYAASIESVFDSSDYAKALEYADAENRELFKRDAVYIERCRTDWVKKASKEKPYDIFISYKDSNRENEIERTQDSYDAQELYYHLKEEGYRVFFSRESLRGMSGNQYEPYIFNALSTAKVMIVYGTKPEYIKATWVKNEWTRYLKRLRAGEKKQGSLLVAYKGFSPKELPSALSSLQCLDISDTYFYTGLLNTIGQILEPTLSEPHDDDRGDFCDHSTTFTVPGRPATCTKSGVTDGVYCEDCGATLKNPTFIPAAGHRFGEWRIAKKATCTEDGEHERVCHCGERETRKIPSRGGHITPEEWETVKAAAPGQTGLKIKKCMVCGETIEEATIPALPIQKTSIGLKYKVNDDGKTCTVTGQGTCQDKEIVIPEEIDGYRVTSIVGGVIEKYHSGFNKDITSVTIPSSVTSIGEDAFWWCKSLASVTIPNSVESIGNNAFYGCESLASVTIPSSVTSIGEDAFSDCMNLANVTIPNSVTSIGSGAFVYVGKIQVSYENPAYTSVDGNLYSKDKKTLIHYAANKKDTAFTIPSSVTSIGERAFSYCTSLVSITIPNSVTSIGEGAFDGCESLTSVTIPNSVTSIGEGAFNCCESLASVVIPNSVTSIGNSAFNGCTSLASVVIPNSVTSIGNSAFNGCTSLTSVTIPNSVTSIGEGAFADCKSLASVTIPNSVTSIGHSAFQYCRSLASVTIPNSVTSIGGWAFCDCTSLASVTIPNSVTSIGAHTFYYCTSLASVTIPNSVTSIGDCAFLWCTSLKNIRYDGTKSQWKQISLENEWRKDSAIRSVTCTKEGFLNNKIKF